MPAQRDRRLFGLVPGVRAGSSTDPRLGCKSVVGKHAKRRDNVLSKIFVLVVAPQHDKIWLKIIQDLACLAELRDQELTVSHGGSLALVVAVFLAHGCGPSGGLPIL